MKSLMGLFRIGRPLGYLLWIVLFSAFGVGAQEIKQATVNYIEVENDMTTLANRVVAYVTVSAADESPVLDIPASDFSVMEDGRPVDLEGLAPASDPMTVILAMDTSGSMLAQDRKTGKTSMTAAKEAAVSFLGMLGPEDRVAVFSFNNSPDLAIDFAQDRTALLDALAGIEAKPNAATCLYDTAYQAVKKSAEIPKGRRAIVLLTDGRDEKGKGTCSTYTAADVIDAATTKSIRVPIFTIGVGPKVDARQLARMASLTGGRSLLAPSASELTRFYQTLADQLKHQYRLTYATRSPSGEHSLVVKVSQAGTQIQDEKRFWSPPLPVCPPAQISFLSPGASQQVKGSVPVRVRITPDQYIQRVRYYVDGILKKELTQRPFDTYSWQTQGLSGGLHVLKVETVDASGKTAAQELTVTVAGPPPAAKTASGPPLPDQTKPAIPVWMMAAAAGLLVVVVGAVWILARRRKSPVEGDACQRDGSAMAESDIEDETVFMADADEGWGGTDPVPPATLTVVQSLVLEAGKSFPVGSRATVGRTDRNDIDIPDKPVSRKHAEIYYQENEFFIRDLGSRNGIKVNGKRIFMEGIRLENDAEIKFGPKTVLRFNCMAPVPSRHVPPPPEEAELEPVAEEDCTIQNFGSDFAQEAPALDIADEMGSEPFPETVQEEDDRPADPDPEPAPDKTLCYEDSGAQDEVVSEPASEQEEGMAKTLCYEAPEEEEDATDPSGVEPGMEDKTICYDPSEPPEPPSDPDDLPQDDGSDKTLRYGD